METRGYRKGRRLPGCLTPEERRCLLDYPNVRYPTRVRDRAIMAAMLYAGLRCSEVLNLRPRDVDLSFPGGRDASGATMLYAGLRCSEVLNLRPRDVDLSFPGGRDASGIWATHAVLCAFDEPEGRGWAFHLPPVHRVTVSPDQTTASLSSPGAGGRYAVREIREDAEEVRIVVAIEPQAAHGLPGQEPGYRFPEIQEELARLKALYASLGGNPAETEAWALGADHDSHTTQLRREIRRLRGEQGAAPSS